MKFDPSLYHVIVAGAVAFGFLLIFLNPLKRVLCRADALLRRPEVGQFYAYRDGSVVSITKVGDFVVLENLKNGVLCGVLAEFWYAHVSYHGLVKL